VASGLLSDKTFDKISKLQKIADEFGATLPQLAIAWILKNKHVSSVILGVSKLEQLKENLKAIEIKEKLDDSLMKEIDQILQS